MLFRLTETQYKFPNLQAFGNAEIAMAEHFRSQDYQVIHNGYSVLYRPAHTDYPDNDAMVRELFAGEALATLDHFYRTLYLPMVEAKCVNPGHPDILVFRADRSEIFFCEVKMGSSDMLTPGQMIGISLIHVFLNCRVQVARVNGNPKTYRWVWPAVQPRHREMEITLPIETWKKT